MSKLIRRKLNKLTACVMLGIMLSYCVLSAAPLDLPATATVHAAETFDGGDGSAVNPYQISDVSQFALVTLGTEGQDKYYVLTADITTASTSLTPLINGRFYGHLDGNGHFIELKQTLCAQLMSVGTIKNINFNCTISGDTTTNMPYYLDGCASNVARYISAIAGASYGVIDNCSGKANINVSSTNVSFTFIGGIVGCSFGGTIRNCGLSDSSLTFTINGTSTEDFIGGLIGQIRHDGPLPGAGATIANCYFKGTARGTGNPNRPLYIGSLIGDSFGGSISISNTYGYNTVTSANKSTAKTVYQGATGKIVSGAITASNTYFGCAADGTSARFAGQNTNAYSGTTRVTADPSPVFTAENGTLRKWATATSYADYANNTGFGRSNLILDFGGTKGAVSNTKVIAGTLTLPSPEKKGFYFLGWSSSPTGSSITYHGGDTYYGNESNMRLYALWQEDPYYGTGFNTIDISNKADEFEIQSHAMNPTDSDSQANLAALKVHLVEPSDEITVYKVADVPYNLDLNMYDDPEWVAEVYDWAVDQGTYLSPVALGASFASEQKSFYNRLFMGDNGTITAEPYSLAPFVPSDYRSESPGDVVTTFNYSGDEESPDPCITLYGFEPGEYAVIATNSGRMFTPVVVNIQPERTLPDGGYSLKDLYEVSLKAAGANVTKYIVAGKADSDFEKDSEADDASDVHMDTAMVGSEIEFRIVVNMPTYKDRVTLSRYNFAPPYMMHLEDHMDSSMVLKEGTEIEVGYLAPETGKFVKITSEPVNYHEYADETYTTGVKVAFDENSNESTDLGSGYYVLQSDSYYAVAPFSNEPSQLHPGETESGFYFDFNMGALKYWAKQNGYTMLPSMEIRYTCVVTENIRVASELNTNLVTIDYEISDDGSEIITVSDVVNLYTYGLNLHKQDGNTYEALADATFNLYKKVLTYSHDPAADMPYEVADDGLFALISEETLENNSFKSDSQYYVYTSRDEAGGFDIDSIYMKLTFVGDNGSLVSTVDEQGKNLTGDMFAGISDGEYILSEIIAPTGYNKVAEDMMFKIDRFSETEAVEAGRSSLAAYKDENGDAVTSGYFDIVVYNYKGLTLPATGGMGTLVFTMIGLGLMAMVLIVLFARRRQAAYDAEYI